MVGTAAIRPITIEKNTVALKINSRQNKKSRVVELFLDFMYSMILFKTEYGIDPMTMRNRPSYLTIETVYYCKRLPDIVKV